MIPYYGYARQDRKVAPRAPITAKLLADLLTTAGVSRVLSVDLHAGQIQGFFNIPFDHLYSAPVLLDYLRQKHRDRDLVVVSPDAGGVERARAIAKRLEAGLAVIDKRRTAPNEASAMHIIGDVEGKLAIVLDDMIDTGGTLMQAGQAVLNHNAQGVFACGTHAVFSGDAPQKLRDSRFEEIIVTDTIIANPEMENFERLTVLSVANLLGEAIYRIHHNTSVSSLFV